MSKAVHPIITDLFLAEKEPGNLCRFSWRLIWRRRRPFLLLPVSGIDVRVSLQIYSAQRRRAKIWRSIIPVLLNTPAAVIFQRIHFEASQNSEIIKFLAEQSGVPVERLATPAIKFGGNKDHKSRLVLLACDQTNRPVKVIKLGLDEEGRAATEREANLLEKLPANTLGCIRMTGRLSTPKLSAFATAFFPGESPDDDNGMELLFHSWINPGTAVPIESLDAWRELESVVPAHKPAEWQVVRSALAGKQIRSTLQHGDFAPWNIRAVNSQNLQAFDWERGHLHGPPAWDWFHFIVQTSILARRYSVERVAAEIEHLLQSPRFLKYAQETGISKIEKPLMLAYLLHHRWVIQPLEGAYDTEELFRLLAQRWGFTTELHVASLGSSNPVLEPAQLEAGSPGLWADAKQQLKGAWSQLANVFWEPTLAANIQPPLLAQFKTAWPLALGCSLFLAALAYLQYSFLNHVMLLPFQAIPCLLLTWNINRRWGTFFACLASTIGPLVAMSKDPAWRHPDLICWNILMRFFMLQMAVFLTDRIHRQRDFFQQIMRPQRRPADFAGNWAIVLVSVVAFIGFAWGDVFTGPRVIFLPLYLLPAILITLFINLSWGAIMVLLAAVVSSGDEYISKYNSSVAEAFGWNLVMRFLLMYLVILLLDRLRQESVLFTPRKTNGHSKPAMVNPARQP